MVISYYKSISYSSASQYVTAAGRIENPVKNRNGTATVSVEAPHRTKVGHWGFPEKAGAEAVDAQVRRPA